MRSRKAQIEVQFNWIFILIVGAIILVFFVSLITTQRRSSEASIAAEVMGKVDTLITGAKVSIGTTNIIDIPRLHLDVDCTGYRVGTAFEIPRRAFSDKIVFSPDRLEGNQLVTWTQEWDVPFRVTNFLYFTTPRIRYVFIYDDSYSEITELALRINKTFPELVERDFITLDQLLSVFDMNNYKVRFIFITNEAPDQFTGDDKDYTEEIIKRLKSTEERDMTALWIKESTKEVYFYSKNLTGDNFALINSTVYFDNPTLFGAIFADDINNYECALEKAIERLYYVAEVYKKRSEKLEDMLLADCQAAYGSAAAQMTSFITLKDENFEDITSSSITGPVSAIQDSNYNLLVRSCPLIY